jgi:hypothetical protein
LVIGIFTTALFDMSAGIILDDAARQGRHVKGTRRV